MCNPTVLRYSNEQFIQTVIISLILDQIQRSNYCALRCAALRILRWNVSGVLVALTIQHGRHENGLTGGSVVQGGGGLHRAVRRWERQGRCTFFHMLDSEYLFLGHGEIMKSEVLEITNIVTEDR
jgi:hypothetical protein